jgi:hypothetical protein
MRRTEVAGYICLRRPRPTQDCRADDEDGGGGGGDDDDEIRFSGCTGGLHFFIWKIK